MQSMWCKVGRCVSARNTSLITIATSALSSRRLFSSYTTILLAAASNSNNSTNSSSNSSSSKGGTSSTAGSSVDEDREEMERERQLRERFAAKVQQGIPNLNSGSFYQQQEQQQQQQQQASFNGWGPSSFGNKFNNNTPNMTRPSSLFKWWFYCIAIFFIISMLPYINPNSAMNTLRGIPWYEVPIATTSYLILLRAIYPRRDEQRIKAEFEEESRRNATLTFDQFINIRYPTLFQGYNTSQAQIVAAVAACLSASKDFVFGRTIVRAAGRARDPRKTVDDIMEALHRDYAELF